MNDLFSQIPGESLPEYIGDGVYVTFDGWHIWLRTQREGRWDFIALEPEVLDNLIKYNERVKNV